MMEDLVFIAHSSKDRQTVIEVSEYLEKNGIHCWYAPRDILPGSSWDAEIVKAISRAKIFLLIYSANSNQSEHVTNEVHQAFNAGCFIIRFIIDNQPMNSGLQYYLARRQWLNASIGSINTHLPSLLKAVNYAMYNPVNKAVGSRKNIYKLVNFALAILLF